jgi:uncharacterized protein
MRIQRIASFIAIIQTILFVEHFLLYKTWTFSSTGHASGAVWTKLILGALSVSFVAASLLAFRYTNPVLRAFYRVAAVWLGLQNFLFPAVVLSWIIFGVARLAGLGMNFHGTVEWLFGAAMLLGFYGVFNASLTRITRMTVRLPNLPESWRGRKAALISDVHLGHVRNGGFLRRMVAKILKEDPDAIFIAGDLYDGTAIDEGRAAEPLSPATTSNSATTANTCGPSLPPAFACSAMRKSTWTVCRFLVCLTAMRRRRVIWRQSCTNSTSIAIAPAFC